MLTAKSEIDDIVEGFHAGCDDYLKKPFDPRELVLRIKKLLSLRNDSKKLINENTLEYKDVIVHIDKHVVLYSDVEIELSIKSLIFLCF
jgi:DNA-binding response OmpR family regulator